MNHAALVANNNMGVDALSRLQVKQAIHHFTNALLEINANFVPIADRQAQISADLENILRDLVFSDSQLWMFSRSAVYMYTKGITIQSRPHTLATDVEAERALLAAIVLCNLALSLHIRAVMDESSSPHFFLKAYQMYRHSLVVVGLMVDTAVSTANPVIDLLLLAVHNNLAHVCLELACYDDADNCYDRLMAFSNTIVAEHYLSEDGTVDYAVARLMIGYVRQMQLNATIFRPKQCASTA